MTIGFGSIMDEQQASCHGPALLSYPGHPLDLPQLSVFTKKETSAVKNKGGGPHITKGHM
jgi:hypothetical protein